MQVQRKRRFGELPGWVAAAFAALFGAGAIYNIVRGDWLNAAGGIGIAAILGGLYLHSRSEEAKLARFLAWLTENAAAIRNGGASFDGVAITSQTRIRRFETCATILIVGFRTSSRFLIEGRDNSALVGIGYTAIALLFGWWSILGPFWTIPIVIRNAMGGHRLTVGDLLAG